MSSIQSIFLITVAIALIPSFVFAQNLDQKYARPKIANSDPYTNSDILTDKKTHTILPNHCILYIPEKLKAYIVITPEKSFTVWPKFYRKNSTWLHCLEVTLDQAKGLTAINPKKLNKIKKLGKVIVAVRHRNPISVLPPVLGPNQIK